MLATPIGVLVTVTAQVAVFSPTVAVIVAEPVEAAATKPVLLTVAMLGSLLLHATALSVALAGSTAAAKGYSSPIASKSVEASKLIPATAIAVPPIAAQLTAQVAAIFPAWAVMVTEPSARDATLPLAVTVALLVSLLLHVTALSTASSGKALAVSV
jgi:hypothetical protein